MQFKTFIETQVLNEEIHKDIMDTANANYSKHYKFNLITKKVRSLIKQGQDTGLVDDKPKKGSSRAVFFPKDDHEAIVDGVQTKIPHVLKISFSGRLDKNLPNDHPLLGTMQNEHEISASRYHSVLTDVGDNKFKSNPEGFLPPLLASHDDGHWMSVGKVSKIDSTSFKNATKTEDFPKGISHKEFRDAVVMHWNESQGRGDQLYVATPKEKLEKVGEHPLVQRALDFCINTDTHPGDFEPRNMGIWTHPVTGEKHVVAADAGFSREVAKAYSKARKAGMRY